MDFIKDIALPQSPEHYQLLLLMMNLTYIVLLPYLGFLLTATIIAVANHRKAGRGDGPHTIRTAHRAMQMALPNASVPAFFGALPALTLVFLYAQILQQTPAIAAGLLVVTFVLLVAALLLLFSYRRTFSLAGVPDVLAALRAKGTPAAEGLEDLASFAEIRLQGHYPAGRWGLSFLALSTVLLVGAMTIAQDPRLWTDVSTVFGLLLSPAFYIKYLLFLALAAGFAGLGMVFFLTRWAVGSREGEKEVDESLAHLASRLSVVSALAVPLLLLLQVFVLPDGALSGGLFALSGAAILLFFLAGLLTLAYRKDRAPALLSYAFYAMGVAILLVFTIDQVAISNATRDQAAKLAVLHAKNTEALKSRLGIAAKSMSGEDIYNAKCSACHLFDQKKVGPPYKEVVPKYAGNKAKLVAFVLNPVKVDPAYPSMPSQGLKPAEADSIATYLLTKYGGTAPTQAAKPGS